MGDRSNLFAAMAILVFAVPLLGQGFLLPTLYGLLAVALLATLHGFEFSLLRIVVVSWTLGLIFVALFSVGEVWELRDFVRIALLAIIVIRPPRLDYIPLLKFAVLGFALLISVDFAVLYLGGDWSPSTSLQEAYAMPGAQHYIAQYWRHIGIGGNPNASGIIYAIAIILCSVFLGGSFERRRSESIIAWGVIGISVFLLLSTFSRTAIISLLVAVLIPLLMKPGRFAIAMVSLTLGGLALFYFNPELWDQMVRRFSEFSAFEERLRLWSLLLNYLDVQTLLFGSTRDLTVIDSDYVFLLFRFGIPGALIVFLAPLVFLFNMERNGISFGLYARLLLLAYIAAIPMGIFANPKFMIFILFAGYFFLGADRGQSSENRAMPCDSEAVDKSDGNPGTVS